MKAKIDIREITFAILTSLKEEKFFLKFGKLQNIKGLERCQMSGQIALTFVVPPSAKLPKFIKCKLREISEITSAAERRDRKREEKLKA